MGAVFQSLMSAVCYRATETVLPHGGEDLWGHDGLFYFGFWVGPVLVLSNIFKSVASEADESEDYSA